MSLVFHISFY
ncbi:Glycosyltransferase-like KOBITO 1 [Zea mays]|uniref:Glycosyltransferase-like KOBITO 1 n=1 Tax=Zea mays TaxID=4577 RepID=A0A1D6QT66_MAIZE|nr:Glycosyltransferase-like KOBITO 1 [Zea mays]AQK40445.1 Glycosyltransferase-like KOBITO 1 [Zea mays]AQK40448.1 Glycosyltransferase-like KOBITO 1 [Zea mays]AQK40451.1 Glycosyltransferase-like KOBITO 1 [Zea mays]AQK60630.1 Glycosyltransferase-like KOBITO 1 [Zea mays]